LSEPGGYEVVDLRAFYGGTEILKGITVMLGAGEKAGIFGHNGSGKSTLLKCLVGAIERVAGSVELIGRPIVANQVSRNVGFGIGVVPQTDNVFAGLTVEQCLRIAGRRSRRPIAEMFEFFPLLRPRLAQRAGSLSGGERQMLAVAMALMTEPRLILLDEPTAGLSPVAAEAALATLSRLNAELGTGLVIVEQNVLPTLRVVDRAIVIRSGRIVYDGPSDALLRHEDLWSLF